MTFRQILRISVELFLVIIIIALIHVFFTIFLRLTVARIALDYYIIIRYTYTSLIKLLKKVSYIYTLEYGDIFIFKFLNYKIR